MPTPSSPPLSYNLGGFRVDSHKMQVYDHCSRVPFVVWGPQLRTQPLGLDIPASFYDLAPTILEVHCPLTRPHATLTLSPAP